MRTRRRSAHYYADASARVPKNEPIQRERASLMRCTADGGRSDARHDPTKPCRVVEHGESEEVTMSVVVPEAGPFDDEHANPVSIAGRSVRSATHPAMTCTLINARSSQSQGGSEPTSAAAPILQAASGGVCRQWPESMDGSERRVVGSLRFNGTPENPIGMVICGGVARTGMSAPAATSIAGS